MSITSLYSAASGMRAMETQLDVIGNNLANSNTHGFKSSRVNFEDLMYEARRQPGSLNGQGDISSTGLLVGLGVRTSNTQLDFKQGAMEETGRSLDIVIEGNGFFKVETFDGASADGSAYARVGNFTINNNGDLVLGTTDGPILSDDINIPESVDVHSISVSSDGVVSGLENGENVEIGTIELHRFRNQQGLKQVGANLYIESDASGPAIAGEPSTVGFGTLSNGFLESSNVDSVTELIRMIRTQRSFELNSQVIKATDETMQAVGRLRN